MRLREKPYWQELKSQFFTAALYLLAIMEGANCMIAIHRMPGQELAGLVIVLLAVLSIASMMTDHEKIEHISTTGLSAVLLTEIILKQTLFAVVPGETKFIAAIALPIALLQHVSQMKSDIWIHN